MKEYRSIESQEVAQLLAELLTENEIPFDLRVDGDTIDAVASTAPGSKIEFWMEEEMHQKVDDLIEEKSEKELSTVDPDHYLFSFSDEELRDVLIKADEWSPLDIALAQKILKDRGQSVDKDEIREAQKTRAEEAAKPESIRPKGVGFMYVLAVIIPLLGLIIGLFWWSKKKMDLRENLVSYYDESTRNHGVKIAMVAVASSVLSILLLRAL